MRAASWAPTVKVGTVKSWLDLCEDNSHVSNTSLEINTLIHALSVSITVGGEIKQVCDGHWTEEAILGDVQIAIMKLPRVMKHHTWIRCNPFSQI